MISPISNRIPAIRTDITQPPPIHPARPQAIIIPSLRDGTSSPIKNIRVHDNEMSQDTQTPREKLGGSRGSESIHAMMTVSLYVHVMLMSYHVTCRS